MSKDFNLDKTPANTIYRKKYTKDDVWVGAFLERVLVGHVATRWDDQPFITPILFWYDVDTRAIYFHTNIEGRLRANAERHSRVCFEACEMGHLFPSNVALEFTMQYASVVVFGNICLITDREQACWALYGLISKYYPSMKPGEEYRPITDQELKRTAVFAIEIESWSGKRHWPSAADQSPDWKLLA